MKIIPKNILKAELEKRLIEQEHSIDIVIPYITAYMADLGNPLRPIGNFLLLGPTGTGKALANTERVLTPNGLVQMKDICKGSFVVGRDGLPTQVLEVYPQGDIDIYKITFEDGRTVECCLNHQWVVFNKHWEPKPTYKILNTSQIKEFLDKSTERTLHIPLCDPVELSEKKLPIDPYLLGALLGDGSLRKSLFFTNTDSDIINKVRNKLENINCTLNNVKGCNYYIGEYGNQKDTFRDKLRGLELLLKVPTTSEWKFVPEIYRNGSIEQRYEILRGLMDTDGTVGKTGVLSFCTTSYQLALDVQNLVWSLGGTAKIVYRFPKYIYKGIKKDGKTAYQVNIRHKEPEKLFSCRKKVERALKNVQYRHRLRLKIKSIEYVNKKAATCITVGAKDSLYLCGKYIVTHNTKTVEVFADVLHDDPNKLIRVDCGQFSQSHEVAKLVGSPPGYLGHRETQPMFSEKKLADIRSVDCDISIILFDEIEKAHYNFYTSMLSILDKGELTTGDNNVVSFKKSLIFCTSNLGAAEMQNALSQKFGFLSGSSVAADKISAKLESIGLLATKKKFSPEFFNRIDEVITYKALTNEGIRRILKLSLDKIHERLLIKTKPKYMYLLITKDVEDFLIAKGFSDAYGARELNRIVQRKLVQPLSDLVLEREQLEKLVLRTRLEGDTIGFDLLPTSYFKIGKTDDV